jgi:hypothetical protein
LNIFLISRFPFSFRIVEKTVQIFFIPSAKSEAVKQK